MQVPTVNHLRTSGDYDPSANCPSLTAQPAASKPIWLIGARSPPTGTIFHNRPPDPVPGLSPPGAWHKVLPHLQLLMPAKRKLRYGMVGGGQNAFIGAVHRMAANLDGQIELVAGAFSSDAKNSRPPAGNCIWIPSASMPATGKWPGRSRLARRRAHGFRGHRHAKFSPRPRGDDVS